MQTRSLQHHQELLANCEWINPGNKIQWCNTCYTKIYCKGEILLFSPDHLLHLTCITEIKSMVLNGWCTGHYGIVYNSSSCLCPWYSPGWISSPSQVWHGRRYKRFLCCCNPEGLVLTWDDEKSLLLTSRKVMPPSWILQWLHLAVAYNQPHRLTDC